MIRVSNTDRGNLGLTPFQNQLSKCVNVGVVEDWVAGDLGVGGLKDSCIGGFQDYGIW